MHESGCGALSMNPPHLLKHGRLLLMLLQLAELASECVELVGKEDVALLQADIPGGG